MARPLFVVTQVAPYVDGPAGVHGALPQAAVALSQLAGLAGMPVVTTADVASLAPAELAAGGVLGLFTIGETPWSEDERAAIVTAVRSGALGVVAVHSATDACHTWPEYLHLVGARFGGHPWTQRFDVEVVDADQPATRPLPSPWSWHDEVYLFDDLLDDAHVLLRVAGGQLDMSTPGARTPSCGFPLAWQRREGEGRCFYTALGHFAGAWENPVYLRHLAGGLRWVLGEE